MITLLFFFFRCFKGEASKGIQGVGIGTGRQQGACSVGRQDQLEEGEGKSWDRLSLVGVGQCRQVAGRSHAMPHASYPFSILRHVFPLNFMYVCILWMFWDVRFLIFDFWFWNGMDLEWNLYRWYDVLLCINLRRRRRFCIPGFQLFDHHQSSITEFGWHWLIDYHCKSVKRASAAGGKRFGWLISLLLFAWAQPHPCCRCVCVCVQGRVRDRFSDDRKRWWRDRETGGGWFVTHDVPGWRSDWGRKRGKQVKKGGRKKEGK